MKSINLLATSFLRMIFYTVLIIQFIFVKTTGASPPLHNGDESLALGDVKITLEISPDNHEYLHLELMNRVLANEHLRIWIMNGETDPKPLRANSACRLTPKHKVMDRLGKFSTYQDPKTSSAAVYYHRLRQFDGMIDMRYLIQGLSVDRIHSAAKTKIRLGESGIIPRPKFKDHLPSMSNSNEDGTPIKHSHENNTRTYKNHLYPGYPEILVIVSCELAQQLLQRNDERPSDWYISIVSYVLTLFNASDMLYSKLQETDIKLNIAGIIIATECESLSFLNDCYDQRVIDNEQHPITFLDAVCAIENIETHLYDCADVISSDFYDHAVFLTGNTLYVAENDEEKRLEGCTLNRGIFDERKLNYLPGFIAVVHDDGHFGSYGVIAHELAHLMWVPHDQPLHAERKKCCEHIMREEGSSWCKECLSWSHTSEQAFKMFFSSSDCCGLINKPRSLHPPGRREMLTALEQCQCYGYESTATFADNISYCVSPLLCLNERGGIQRTLIPMDGTTCSIGKVCWDKKCQHIEDFHKCKLKN